MAISESLAPVGGMIGGGLSGLLKYSWVLFIFVGIAIIVSGIFIWKNINKKNSQWTHKLRVRRVLQNNLLSDTIIHKMRRFPLIKKAEVFELEKSLLGGYLMPELDEYSGVNEFSIILDKNNRIYTNKGEYFCKDKSSVSVSARHAEIDIQRATLKSDFQNINKLSKRMEWATIAKYAFMALIVIVIMVVTIVALQKWGDAQESKSKSDMANAKAMENLATAMEIIQATVNTQKLEILPMMKEIYKTKNIQGIINEDLPDEAI